MVTFGGVGALQDAKRTLAREAATSVVGLMPRGTGMGRDILGTVHDMLYDDHVKHMHSIPWVERDLKPASWSHIPLILSLPKAQYEATQSQSPETEEHPPAPKHANHCCRNP